MDNEEFKKRLNEFRVSIGLSVNSFEKKAGLSNGYIKNFKGNMGRDKLEKLLAAFPELNRDWLLTGEGDMVNDRISSSNDFASYEIDTVPLIPDEAIAGFQGGFIEGVNYFDCRLVRSPFPGAEIAIQVSGDSMMPAIKSGDRLYLRKIDEKAFIPWGHAVVLDTINGAVVKEIQPCPQDEDCILAVSANSKYPPYKIEKSSINGIYKILGSITINSTF